MNKILRKHSLMLAISGVLLSVSPGVSEASLKSQFESATISAAPGTYDVMGRTVHQGGYARMRLPTMGTLKVVQFQSPSFEGGCKGFDLFGGSFSYLGKDELVEYLKAVATNTSALATYMFLTYLQENCATCKDVMDGLYALQEAVNQTFSGSCETAKGILGGVKTALDGEPNADWELMTNRYKDVVQKYSVTAGHFEDAAGSIFEIQSDPTGAARTAINDQNERDKATTGGNVLYWAIKDLDLVDVYKPMLKSGLTQQELFAFLTYIAGNYVAGVSTDKLKSAPYTPSIVYRDVLSSRIEDIAVPGGAYSSTNVNEIVTPLKTILTMFPDLNKIFEDFDCAIIGRQLNGASCGSSWVGLVNIYRKSEKDLPPGFDFATSPEKAYMERLNTGSIFTGALIELGGSTGLMEELYRCHGDMIKIEFAENMFYQMLDTLRKSLDKLEGVESNAVLAYKNKVGIAIKKLREEIGTLKKATESNNCELSDSINNLLIIRQNAGAK